MENDKYIPTRAFAEDPADDSASLRNPDDPIPEDPRQWPLDENISTPNTDYKGDRNYDDIPDDRADNDPYVPYKGYQGNDNRALQVNPATGQMRAAPNQDGGGGDPYMGATGGWSDFSGRGGGGGGSGFTDFSGLT